MASTIQVQTIGSADQCIALSASQFGRPHGYGDNWNTLRFAILYSVENAGATISGIVLRIGLCHGTNNMPGDATTANSFGIKQCPVWVFSSPMYNQYNGATRPFSFSRVGTSEALGSLSNGTTIGQVGGARTAFFLDVIKGSPNYTFQMFFCSTGAVDITPAAFLGQVGSTSPALSGHTYTGPVGALAINTGTNGILDTVYVGWNLVTPRLFISDIAVVRLA